MNGMWCQILGEEEEEEGIIEDPNKLPTHSSNRKTLIQKLRLQLNVAKLEHYHQKIAKLLIQNPVPRSTALLTR